MCDFFIIYHRFNKKKDERKLDAKPEQFYVVAISSQEGKTQTVSAVQFTLSLVVHTVEWRIFCLIENY